LTGTELVIAIASLSVVMLLAYPSFQGMAINGNLKAAAKDLVADLDILREKAVLESTPLVLTFDVPGNTYRSPGLRGGMKSPANIAADISLIQASFGGENRLTFLSKGTLSQQGNIVLTNSRGSTATITCSLSGRAYVKFLMQ
jgi:Tfp pilus assembly protein FimT